MPLPTGDPEVSLLTFNTGLIQLVKGPEERKPHVIAHVSASTADVICLQEIFNQYTSGPDMAAALRDAYPYAYWTTTGTTNWGNGLLLVSKHPMYRGRELYYVAQDPGGYVDRMVIAADVLTPTSYFTVMCAHLQAGLDPQYRQVKRDEIDETVAWAEAQGYFERALFWLGDFNAGPDPTGQCVEGRSPPCEGSCTSDSQPCTLAPDVENYVHLLETFADGNETWNVCSSCREQFIPMAVLPIYTNEPDQRIDHCFHRSIGTSAHVGVDRVFDEGIEIEANGETLYWLSDHYGVQCSYSP